jgi:RNA polymerase sigma factor (sigma-70 family)
MTEEQARFNDLMELVRNGDEQAAHDLLEMYGSHIQRAVRRRLHRRLRSKFDSQDFVQAVWASFFGNLNQVRTFDCPEALLAFLTRVAGNKVVDECRRRLMTQKNDVKREVSIDNSEAFLHHVLHDQQPTPSEFAMANEQWDHIVDGQPLHYAEILRMRATGATHKEIAESLGINPSTVRRAIQRLAGQIPRHAETDSR